MRLVQETYPDLQRRIGDIDSISLSQAVEQNVHIAIVARQTPRQKSRLLEWIVFIFNGRPLAQVTAAHHHSATKVN